MEVETIEDSKENLEETENQNSNLNFKNNLDKEQEFDIR